MKLVRQEDGLGCQIAVCAMVLGLSYVEAKMLFPAMAHAGYSHMVLDAILAERGIGVARLYRHDVLRGREREPWPPQPWADVHFAVVVNDFGGHAVVMLADGSVLDPADGANRRLTDYKEVHHVAAIVRPRC